MVRNSDRVLTDGLFDDEGKHVVFDLHDLHFQVLHVSQQDKHHDQNPAVPLSQSFLVVYSLSFEHDCQQLAYCIPHDWKPFHVQLSRQLHGWS